MVVRRGLGGPIAGVLGEGDPSSHISAFTELNLDSSDTGFAIVFCFVLAQKRQRRRRDAYERIDGGFALDGVVFIARKLIGLGLKLEGHVPSTLSHTRNHRVTPFPEPRM